MDVTETREAVNRILEESLSNLTEFGSLSIFPPANMEDWQLPDDGKVALSLHGLPPVRSDDLMGISGDFQQSSQPTVWARMARSTTLLDIVGSARIAVTEDAGRVLAVPASSKVHPALTPLHPSGLTPVLANSTVARLVECAWRLHWVVSLLDAEQHRAEEEHTHAWANGVRGADLPDTYVEYQGLCGEVLERFRATDPEIQTDSGFWSEIIIDVW